MCLALGVMAGAQRAAHGNTLKQVSTLLDQLVKEQCLLLELGDGACVWLDAHV